MNRMLPLVAAILALALLAPPADAVRVKDLARVDGMRPNQLIGYGLVVGLDRTGDSHRVDFTLQSLTAMLSRLGVRIDPRELRLQNVAAVMVTASLSASAGRGTPMDVVVSAIGDSRSLQGGTLLLTPMKGLDGATYAMAQGPLQVGGFGVRGRTGSRLTRNHLNVGRVPGGAIVEREVPVVLAGDGTLRLRLDRPDFLTAQRLADAINGAAATLGGAAGMARATSAAMVEVTVPEDRREEIAGFISVVEVLDVDADAVARVVINGRTGTIVMGEDVAIDAVAIAHGPLTLEIEEAVRTTPAAPLTDGATAVTPASRVAAREAEGQLKLMPQGANLASVVRALNALGARPRDLVDILQAIDAAGALHARLEVQ